MYAFQRKSLKMTINFKTHDRPNSVQNRFIVAYRRKLNSSPLFAIRNMRLGGFLFFFLFFPLPPPPISFYNTFFFNKGLPDTACTHFTVYYYILPHSPSPRAQIGFYRHIVRFSALLLLTVVRDQTITQAYVKNVKKNVKKII